MPEWKIYSITGTVHIHRVLLHRDVIILFRSELKYDKISLLTLPQLLSILWHLQRHVPAP